MVSAGVTLYRRRGPRDVTDRRSGNQSRGAGCGRDGESADGALFTRRDYGGRSKSGSAAPGVAHEDDAAVAGCDSESRDWARARRRPASVGAVGGETDEPMGAFAQNSGAPVGPGVSARTRAHGRFRDRTISFELNPTEAISGRSARTRTG